MWRLIGVLLIMFSFCVLWSVVLGLILDWVDPHVERWIRRRVWRRLGGEGEPPTDEELKDERWPLR